ncbi:MAG: ParB N-terminal domain-containing protein [Rhodospirillaceae bacterium]|nr:ParB N-terminal domain-containing protein [Rhodospirillaceae bacterium]
MDIQESPVGDLIPYASNSRTHSDEQVAQIAASIKEFGFNNPILLDGDKGIIAGHGRILAARKLGLDKVPTIELAHLSENQRKACIIADNKLAENSGWDMDFLNLEMKSLDNEGFDLSLLGFDETELTSIFATETEGLTDPDEIPDLPDTPVSKLGDVWLLGEHRLMCGDSTDATAVAALLAADKADMVFTDPPYGMSYGGGRSKAHGEILGDELKGHDLVQLVSGAVSLAKANAKSGAAFYICFPWRTYAEFLAALCLNGMEPSACIVWDKKSIGLGRSNYRPQHEFIFYVKGDVWHGDRAQSDVWYMSRGATGDYVHPTQKPVELIGIALGNSSKNGDLVLDLFGGSGTTLIAAQQNGRKSCLMELDPKYADVIIKRWQNFTGKQAKLEGTEEFFPSIKENG